MSSTGWWGGVGGESPEPRRDPRGRNLSPKRTEIRPLQWGRREWSRRTLRTKSRSPGRDGEVTQVPGLEEGARDATLRTPDLDPFSGSRTPSRFDWTSVGESPLPSTLLRPKTSTPTPDGCPLSRYFSLCWGGGGRQKGPCRAPGPGRPKSTSWLTVPGIREDQVRSHTPSTPTLGLNP